MSFISSDAGAVTVDWVVLTGALVGLGLAAMSVVSSGVEDLSKDVSKSMHDTIIKTSFPTNTDPWHIAGDPYFGGDLSSGYCQAWETYLTTGDQINPGGFAAYDCDAHTNSLNTVYEGVWRSSENFYAGDAGNGMTRYENTYAEYAAYSSFLAGGATDLAKLESDLGVSSGLQSLIDNQYGGDAALYAEHSASYRATLLLKFENDRAYAQEQGWAL